MKRSFYPRLAIDGMRKNRRMYGPYLAMGALMAAICYILSALSRSDALRTLPGGDNLCMIMALGNVVLLIFSVIFLFYTNSFLIRRRRREFGLYNVLGMSKRNLARILTWETLLTAAIVIAGGLFFGMLLSKLIELAIVKMMDGTATLAFPFDLSALLGTAGGFAVIYALLWLVSVVRVGRSTAVALLRSEAAGEKPPRANWFLSLLGLILLGAAYYLAVSIKNPLDAITWFFVAVVLVIFATYLLMITTSVLLCRVLQKDKRYYYRANHFVSVSSMAYRMKRNGAGLASICILATMVLVMISSTASLYFGKEDSLRTQYPREVNVQLRLSSLSQMEDRNLDLFRTAAQQAVEDCGGEMQNVMDHRYISTTGYPMEDGIEMDWREYEHDSLIYSKLRDYFFVTEADYEAQTGEQLDIPEGAVALRTYDCDDAPLELRIRRGGTLRVAESRKGSDQLGLAQNSNIARVVVIVPDMQAILDVFPASIQDIKDSNSFRWVYGFDTGLDADGQRAVSGAVSEHINALDLGEGQGYDWYSLALREANRADFYGNYAGMFALGILLSIVFILAAVLIIYYKQLTEGYEDQARFAIMQNVGMTRREIRRSINSQLLTVFYLPLLFAGLHLAFAFPMIRRLLMLFSLYNIGLFAAVTAISFTVFAALYAVVYRQTAGAYYAIVSGGRDE